jgi:16S rRNA processing protein RimM
VVTNDGTPVGEVTGIEPSPAHDLWVVRGTEREHLIPAVPEIVQEVDLDARRVVIRPPEGLLEL